MGDQIINVDCLIRLKQSRIERPWPTILDRLVRSLLLDELPKGNPGERPCGPDWSRPGVRHQQLTIAGSPPFGLSAFLLAPTGVALTARQRTEGRT
jgi:hypothetical protein